jgi:hypothetical protein
MGDVLEQPVMCVRRQSQLDNFSSWIKTPDGSAETDDVEYTSAGPKRRLNCAENASVRIGKIVFVAPTEFDKFCVGKIDQFWQSMERNIGFAQNNASMPRVVNDEDWFAGRLFRRTSPMRHGWRAAHDH